jgi:hypothetical protein
VIRHRPINASNWTALLCSIVSAREEWLCPAGVRQVSSFRTSLSENELLPNDSAMPMRGTL